MADSQKNADSRTPTWPMWMRTLSGLSGLGVVAIGICIAIVPGFEIRHANSVGPGLKLTGITAVVVGLGVVVWGGIFLCYVLSPGAAIWKRTMKRRTRSSTDPAEITSESGLDE